MVSKQTHLISQNSEKRTRNKLPFLGLFLGFIFISLATISIIKIFRPKPKEYLLNKDTCLSNLHVKITDKEQICNKLVSQINFSDFKIEEDVAYKLNEPLDNKLVAKIELPTTDYYNSITDLKPVNIDDANLLAQNKITFIDINNLTPSKKLLSIDDEYYLDNQDAGARFTILFFSAVDTSKISILKEKLKPLYEKYQKRNLVSFAETGVTALTRRMTLKLNQVGTGVYFADYITDFLKSKTFTHLSNEVSFKNHCPGGYQTMSLCADWRMLDTITTIGTDIIELTGNHNNDAGIENNLQTIAKYRQLGIKTVGGGENLSKAREPLDINNSIRLLAYNQSTSSVANGQLATNDHPGANPYSEEQVKLDLQNAKKENKFTIVNIQYFECYAYPNQQVAYPLCDQPIQNQKDFFRHLIDLGADIVVGTSAHQPQTYELYQNKPIFYGLGNLFFDQSYWPDTRRSLIITHYFDGANYLQTRISPTVYDETFRTRLLTPDEAQLFLSRLLEASPKGN